VWTFGKAATEVHKTLLPGWKNPKHGDQWINTLTTYAIPKIGERAVAEVDVGAVVEVLKPIWTTKPETARRVRQRIDAVLRWAVAHGYATTNPVDAAVELLPKQRDVVEHHKAVPVAALPGFMATLRAGDAPSRRALEFAILTAARSGEVRGAVWSEIDLKAKTWTVPAARMKAARDHEVPLSDAAIAVLQAAGEGAGGALVFPGPKGKAMSDAVFTALLERMGVDATAHGFRSTFRDWCSENGVPREIAERALAHAVGNSTEGAYLRTTLLEQRRDVMERWAGYCASA
jgi:integrase